MFIDLVFLKVIVPAIAFFFTLLLGIIAYFLRTIHKDFIDKFISYDKRLDNIEMNVTEIHKDIIYIKTKVNI